MEIDAMDMQEAMESDDTPTPLCPYCGEYAVNKSAHDVYGFVRQEWRNGRIWVCEECDARVGCHHGTSIPLGTLADATLRSLRKNAHTAFDPLWKGATMSRTMSYKWLSEELGMSDEECHIGRFNEEQCILAIRACNGRMKHE